MISGNKLHVQEDNHHTPLNEKESQPHNIQQETVTSNRLKGHAKGLEITILHPKGPKQARMARSGAQGETKAGTYEHQHEWQRVLPIG